MVQIHFIAVAGFMDFARFVCAFREHPLRVYAHKLNGKMILATRLVLANSMIVFYTNYQSGRYIEYDPKGGKETARVTQSIGSGSNHAPIVHLETLPFPLKTPKRISIKFKTSRVSSLGNLARLTYNPERPDDPEVTLLCFLNGKKWVLGYISTIELENRIFCFYYVELDEEPTKPFIKYSGHKGIPAQFTDTFQHGFPYLPVVKLKKGYPIFGLKL